MSVSLCRILRVNYLANKKLYLLTQVNNNKSRTLVKCKYYCANIGSTLDKCSMLHLEILIIYLFLSKSIWHDIEIHVS